MKRKLLSLIMAVSICLSLLVYSPVANDPVYAEDELEDNIYEVTENNVRFLGRTYKEKKDGAYYFNWPAAGFEFKFEGTKVIAELVTNPTEKPERWPQIYVFVDGKDHPDEGKIITINPKQTTYVLAEDLPYGEHTIKVMKRNGNIIGGNIFEDHLASMAGVKSLNIPGGKLLDPPPAKKFKLEFIGDSITVGAGVLGEDDDALRTYAAYTARELDADFNVQAISGMGLICSIFGDKFIELPNEFPWTDKLNAPGVKWDYSKYQADVVVVNLGTNDTAGVGPGKKYSYQDYEDGYVDFIMNIKKAYPRCIVIAAFGAMGREQLFPYIQNAVDRANEAQGEEFAYFLELVENQAEDGVGGGGHPTEKAHIKHSKALVALINEVVDWDLVYEETPPPPVEETPEESPTETGNEEDPGDNEPVDEETPVEPQPEETPDKDGSSNDNDKDNEEAPKTFDSGFMMFALFALLSGMTIALGKRLKRSRLK